MAPAEAVVSVLAQQVRPARIPRRNGLVLGIGIRMNTGPKSEHERLLRKRRLRFRTEAPSRERNTGSHRPRSTRIATALRFHDRPESYVVMIPGVACFERIGPDS